MKLKKKDLLKAGYKEFSDDRDRYKKLYQKFIKDEQGKRFALNFYYYDFSMPPREFKGFTAKAQFSEVMIGKMMSFANIELDATDLKIDDVEKYFNALWVASGKPYYERWDEQ